MSPDVIGEFMRSPIIAAMIAVMASWPLTPGAQTRAQTEPDHSVAPVIYQSVFNTYTAFRDEPVGDWRKLNADLSVMGMAAEPAASPSRKSLAATPNALNHDTHQMLKDK